LLHIQNLDKKFIITPIFRSNKFG